MRAQSRRRFVQSILAATSAAVVVGFDPKSRSWVTKAQADTDDPFEDLPHLDGVLLLDEPTRN